MLTACNRHKYLPDTALVDIFQNHFDDIEKVVTIIKSSNIYMIECSKDEDGSYYHIVRLNEDGEEIRTNYKVPVHNDRSSTNVIDSVITVLENIKLRRVWRTPFIKDAEYYKIDFDIDGYDNGYTYVPDDSIDIVKERYYSYQRIKKYWFSYKASY